MVARQVSSLVSFLITFAVLPHVVKGVSRLKYSTKRREPGPKETEGIPTALELFNDDTVVDSIGINNITNVGTSDILDVIVIGAGWSGLGAAKYLKTKGFNVKILEARDYIGGRAQSTTVDGITINTGANWLISYECNPLSEFFDSIEAEMQNYTFDYTFYDKNGAIEDSLLDSYADYLYSGGWINRAYSDSYMIESDEPLLKSAKPIMNKIDKLSKPKRKKRVLSALQTAWYEIPYGQRMEQASLWYWDAGAFLCGKESYWKVVQESMADIATKFAEDVTSDIRLNTVVTKIDYSSDDLVQVIAKDSTDDTIIKTYHARKVILTVPLGVLKSGNIDLELTQEHQNSINNMAMGKQIRFFMFWEASDVFWPGDAGSLYDTMSKENSEKIVFHVGSTLRGTDAVESPFLVGVLSSEEALRLEEKYAIKKDMLYKEKLTELAMKPLRRMFLGAPEPKATLAPNWNVDPFAFGVYSTNPVNGSPYMRKELAKPLDKKVFISGEATSLDYYGSIHGAYLTGVRTAKHVKRVLKKEFGGR
mmetsp:Transcript_18574/g.21373  ORF Transcript_18574/g.21373 Transcript_18574/m.21373 type:complete len:535 (-) Transcript_18574:256-1860(-)